MFRQLAQKLKARLSGNWAVLSNAESGIDSLRQYATATKRVSAKKAKSESEKKKAQKQPVIPALEFPKRPASPYNLFFTEYYKKKKDDSPNLKLTEIAKLGGDNWRNMPDDQKNVYNERYKKAKSQYDEEYQKWRESLSPKVIALENKRRRIEKAAGRSNQRPLKDPKAPKRPRSSYLQFAMENMAEYKDLKVTERSKAIAQKWKALSPDERKPFEELYVKEKERYNQELENYKKIA
ncbi:7696_t:CDS:2 [Acaulospora colombiana]|uniref:7696_t:CDS:1 n=1 Tax=Acaulospora colombiana TaxID=27376 RepID=A0ACA9KUA9_9GLOM|nr:7696_t:CDS:2 [Acaulospora colombiana]